MDGGGWSRWLARFDTVERVALVAWVLVLAAVCSRVWLAPHHNSVFTIYAHAAQRWLAGAPLDQIGPGDGDPYRYGPGFIPVILPFALLPNYLGGILWRLACAGCYLGAFAWFVAVLKKSRCLAGVSPGWLWLLILPMSVGSINNGQANVLMIGLLLSAVAAAAQRRWAVTAMCAAWCCLFKVYPIAFALLLAVSFFRPFSPRFVAALAAGLMLPFLFQQPAYVVGEYGEWVRSFVQEDARRQAELVDARRDLRLLLRLFWPQVPDGVPLALSLCLAGVCALVCLIAKRRGWPALRLLLTVFFLSVCWMLLCGPATESATYILLAPLLAWRAASILLRPGWAIAKAVVAIAVAAFVIYHAACWLPDGRRYLFALQPAATLLLVFQFGAETLRIRLWTSARSVDARDCGTKNGTVASKTTTGAKRGHVLTGGPDKSKLNK